MKKENGTGCFEERSPNHKIDIDGGMQDGAHLILHIPYLQILIGGIVQFLQQFGKAHVAQAFQRCEYEYEECRSGLLRRG